MVSSLIIKDNTPEKEILFFQEIKKLKKINILFGGNGIGKSTLLKGINNYNIDLQTDNEVIILKYINSQDNCKGYLYDHNYIDFKKAIQVYDCSGYSEGQTIINHILVFLQEVETVAKKNKTKDIFVTIDEMDSGLSIENINMILHFISDLLNKYSNLQFIISTNQYHYVYVFKNVINMYTGEWITINTYEEYFKLLNEGIQIMNKNNKRNFDFLKV